MNQTLSSRTVRRALVVLAAAVLGGGCMGSDDDEAATTTRTVTEPAPMTTVPETSYPSDFWRPVIRSDCAERLATPLPAERYYVYFSCEPRPGKGPIVQAAAARILASADATPRRALRVLLRGPTSGEQAAGFFSNFGPKTRDIPFSVTVDDTRRLAVVDLDPAILEVEFAFVSLQEVAQITSTVGQFPPVRRVEIRIGGEALCAALGEC